MKRFVAMILIFAALAAMLCGCGNSADTVIINGAEYKTGFYGRMNYTGDEAYMTEEFEGPYCRLKIEGHNWWLDELGFVYCPAEEFDAEKAFYADKENIGVYVTFGELTAPLDTLQLTGIDEGKVDDLLKFAARHRYDPEKPKKDHGQVQCPLPENRDGEAHFYYETADGLFSRGKGDTYYMINGYFLQLYYYSDGLMYVVQVPDEIGGYFTDLLNKLGGFSLES